MAGILPQPGAPAHGSVHNGVPTGVRPARPRLWRTASEPAPALGILHRVTTPPTGPRFLQLADVAEVLNTSAAQVYALVRSGELPAIKIGGRGQWRVETSELERYIERMYAQTREFVESHQFGRAGTGDEDGPAQG